jgi:hypothetical protein
MDPTLITLALVVVALGYVLTLTYRTIRGDRPQNPPGAPTDWRAEALDWNRLGIR